MIENLSSLNLTTLTQIQELSFPQIFDKNDFIIQSATGSGKSAVFIINTLKSIEQNDKFHTLVLTPTRELSNQVSSEFKRFARYKPNIKVLTLCGGVPSRGQKNSLAHGANIIVGTPGRVFMLLREGFLNLENLKTFVLDEADRMLEMGFFEDIEQINSYLPKNKQTLLFSATYEDNIKDISNKLLNNPTLIKATHNKPKINEENIKLKAKDKKLALLNILASKKPKSAIIFCNQKITCDSLQETFDEKNILSNSLHSDFEQQIREEIITLFSNGSYPILIATDVASRGLDIDDVEMVINYDIPRDEKVKTHRIGRTARAGKDGIAINFYTEDDLDKKDDIEFIEAPINNEVINLDITSDYKCLYISGGKGLKLRKGDILGTLVKDIKIDAKDIGDITIFEKCSYVAIKKGSYKNLEKRKTIRIKNKEFRIFPR